ncbi:asparaginase [Acidovorax sp. NCPPB 3859]|nr:MULTISPECIES: asparaginase [unclassified Acidovorax]MDA8448726.1 asparaginase [Acidovorax sp. GBBC 3297]MDA8458155.1 asparaginase [Acidovorax sp. GBBC 3333]MDA8463193.1 asparaginase [Acidovorax sp. GBBC 3332]MDA8468202.1 asparaginase [Acidovorax sp. GBBC 3299]WCM79808.1 asparaginase [Acidovorax sp. GBBC 712]
MHFKNILPALLAAAGLLSAAGPAGAQATATGTPSQPTAAPQPQAAAKPRVAILATGGTIASRGANNLALTDYGLSSGLKPVGIEALVAAVPEIERFATISGEQIFNVGSSKLSIDNWLTLAQRANQLLASGSVDGIVITHGTDTLEETAYFLNLVVKSDKPVVLVGSMRPSTGMSADGPLNLVNAVALAASREAQGKGVMVVMNESISGAFGVTKTNTTNVATFKTLNGGELGYMQNSVPYFIAQPLKRHTLHSEFDVSGLKALPRVDINYTTLGSDGVLVDAAVAAGARGIVNAGVGHANMPDATLQRLKAARQQGVAVVVASRVPSGLVTPVGQFTQEGFVSAMMHSPQKARILLMLALTRTTDPKEIQRIFDAY